MQSFVIAKVLVINEAGELLLLKRSQSDKRRPDQWDFPGGWVDSTETAWAAAIRETQEETGITIQNPQLVYAFSEVVEKGNGTWLSFIARVSKKPSIVLSNEHHAYEWMIIEKALTTVTYDRQLKMLEHVDKNGLLG